MRNAPSSAKSDTRPLAAALCMICAMMLLGFVDNYIATIAQHISVWQFLSMRAVMSLPLIWILSRMGLGSMRPKRLWAVALRSALISIGMTLYFGSLAFIPIAQSLAGLFTSPIFVLLISIAILKQRIGPWRILAVSIGFCGILLVLGFKQEAPGWIMIMPVAGGFFYATGSLATRLLCAKESTVCMLLGIMGFQWIIGTAALIFLAFWGTDLPPEGSSGFLIRPWVWSVSGALPYIALQAVVSVLGVFLLIRAYQWGEASQVSVLEYSIMIFGPFFGWLLMGQVMTASMIVGILMIICAGGIIAMRARE